MSNRYETLLDDAEERLSAIEERHGDLDDSLDGLEDGIESFADRTGEGKLKDTLEDLAALVDVLDEAEDLFETIDLSDLPDAVDRDELLEAIHVGEIPDALEDGDGDEVVELRQLVRAVNLSKLLESMDLWQFWEEKGELDDAVDDLTDEEEEETSIVGEAVDEATDAVSGDDGDDEGMLEEAADDLEESASTAFGSAEEALEDGDLDEYQALIQRQALEGIDEFRDALLVTHEKFQQLYEYNRDRMRRTDKSTHSRNPTAVSTMAIDRADLGEGAKHSTVPQGVRHSGAPTRKRIYGRRFETELERRRREHRDRTRTNGGDGGD